MAFEEKELEILIVDDSRVFRSILEGIFQNIEGVRVVGSVWSGEKALEFLQKQSVDMVTLDIEMPGLGGLETLQRITALELPSPPGVLMISSLTRNGADTTLRALELGAFDFVAKPGPEMQGAAASLERVLNMKINGWRNRHMASRKPSVEKPSVPVAEPRSKETLIANGKIEAILIGVSTGGPRALTEMLPLLAAQVQCPICIVQHMPPVFTKSLAQTLDKKCLHRVVEAAEGMVLEKQTIYVAPGGQHMTVRKRTRGIEIALNEQEPEHGCRPSVDVLFRSAAEVFSHGTLVAIIMTGMGCDGTAGLRLLKKMGTYAVVQDENTSVVWGMPGAAVAANLADETVPLLQIPAAVAKRCKA
jgi:two-component system, chemotaxis family, protein-glutamate methylesterase/glutaminase